MKLKKIKIFILVGLLIIVIVFISIQVLGTYYPAQEPDRIRTDMAQVLQAHEKIGDNYSNPTVLRGKSGDYFIVFDQEEGKTIGCVRAKNRFFDFGKTKISSYGEGEFRPDAGISDLIVSSYGNVQYGKFINSDIVKIEFYIDNLLEQTFMRNDDPKIGSKDFYLVELDEKYYQYGAPNVRLVCYNEKGEVLYEL